MSPRQYRMKRRGQSAEQTRQRIVLATYELHAERGIAATSMRDIAERADVAVGTVYHHFPTYDHVIDACGEYTQSVTCPPSREVLRGIDTADERVRALVEAVFEFYERFPGYERVRADRDRFPQLERFLRQDEKSRRDMLAAAVAPRKPGRRRVAMALAVLDIAVYRSLIRSGLGQRAAVTEASHLLRQWLLEPGTASTRSRTGRASRA